MRSLDHEDTKTQPKRSRASFFLSRQVLEVVAGHKRLGDINQLSSTLYHNTCRHVLRIFCLGQEEHNHPCDLLPHQHQQITGERRLVLNRKSPFALWASLRLNVPSEELSIADFKTPWEEWFHFGGSTREVRWRRRSYSRGRRGESLQEPFLASPN